MSGRKARLSACSKCRGWVSVVVQGRNFRHAGGNPIHVTSARHRVSARRVSPAGVVTARLNSCLPAMHTFRCSVRTACRRWILRVSCQPRSRRQPRASRRYPALVITWLCWRVRVGARPSTPPNYPCSPTPNLLPQLRIRYILFLWRLGAVLSVLQLALDIRSWTFWEDVHGAVITVGVGRVG